MKDGEYSDGGSVMSIGAGILLTMVSASGYWPLMSIGADQECSFVVSNASLEPTVRGSNWLLARTEVVRQPDSPVRVISADFQFYEVTTTSAMFEQKGLVQVDIKNVSDLAIDSATIWLKVLTRTGSVGT